MTDASVEPDKSAPEIFFKKALAQGRFIVQQCKDCGKHVGPHGVLCSHCGSSDLKWVEPTGKAVISAIMAVTAQPEPGSGYTNVQVELEEGPVMTGRVLDVEQDKATPGMKVSVHVGLIDGQSAVVFYNLEQGSNEW